MTKLKTIDEVSRLAETMAGAGGRVISLSGLTSIAAKARVLEQLRLASGKRFAVIADSNTDAEIWECDLDFWIKAGAQPGATVVNIPAFETDIYSGTSPHAETQERRAIALWRMLQSPPDFVVLPAKAIAFRTIAPSALGELGARLSLDDDLDPSIFVDRLVRAGYVRADPISGVGEFSLRGGIVDFWSPDSDSPVRVEFFGDTVDSIRSFDAETQLSTGQLKEASAAPMREFAASDEDFREWAFFARERFARSEFARNLKDRTDFADEGEGFSGWEFLMPLVRKAEGSVFAYLSNHIFVVDEPSIVEQNLASLFEHLDRHYAETLAAGDVALAPDELFFNAKDLRLAFESDRRIELRALGRASGGVDEQFQLGDATTEAAQSGTLTVGVDDDSNAGQAAASRPPLFLFPAADRAVEFDITSRATRKFYGDLRQFSAAVKSAPAAPMLVARTHGMAERIAEIANEFELPPPNVVVGDLSSGFELPLERLYVYTENDIFGETQRSDAPSAAARTRPKKSARGAFISDFRDLKPGDYVVHIDHGIGRFQALQTLESGGIEREFMLLIYADDAKLFVPVERMELVSRYASGEAASPALDRLGSIGWQKTKAKAKRAMRDMADELLRLYAERKLVQGYAFSSDAPWQHEFEDAFPFDLTADQARAIEDVKADMETPRPMDRLIIGDVGYGKTEVAMRAAFKAVMDGRQTAVLTPTTILAYQHFESFRKRFAAFPVKIDLLSRFRSASEQKAVVEAAEKGDVDILIGTHRILSNDVKLPKLGLVVVDEEQRFGVAHKEKLKQLKKKVDVLTLSATPIPRTLNMSLLGMRDMSVIETPPRDRLAISTQVVQFSEGVIRSAVELELSRNGQIFFIHNRVETIDAIAAHIQKIVPAARIAVGHGQMNEKVMETKMLDFIDYKYDILVATTIIENGIDIPRANTIIINRADNYGLSQLYQLRGRVGRSNRRAYAYLLIPGELELTPIARRRLSAIREFSDLGAGFRIAALDLELRGAGNILGGQQSGHLDALGFDLYTKMLERTIAEIRGDEIADETSVSINLGVDVSIPKDYISEAGQRLRTYKRISEVDGDEELNAIRTEIEDRYGKIPRSLENLFAYSRLRRTAERIGVVSVDKTSDGLAIKLGANARVRPESIMHFLSEVEGASFSPNGILRFAAGGGDVIESSLRTLDAICI